MRSEEETSVDAFGNPLLMEHHTVIVCDSEIEESGGAGNDKIEAVCLACLFETVGQLCAELPEELGSVDRLELIDAGDTGGERNGTHPVGAGV